MNTGTLLQILTLVGICRLYLLIINDRSTNMATKQEIMEAVTAEADEVKAHVDALDARIAELIAAGGGATPADLDEILAGVRGIFTRPA